MQSRNFLEDMGLGFRIRAFQKVVGFFVGACKKDYGTGLY